MSLGIGAVAVAALRPLRGALGVRRPIVERAYALALAQVGLGVLLAVGMVAGVTPIAERWGLLKPAHAWLNVFGFLTVVIAATLVHLAPTVAGGRIRPRRSALVAVACLAAAPLLVATGLALATDLVVRAGAGLELVGAVALVVHALAVQRDRGRWTTDQRLAPPDRPGACSWPRSGCWSRSCWPPGRCCGWAPIRRPGRSGASRRRWPSGSSARCWSARGATSCRPSGRAIRPPMPGSERGWVDWRTGPPGDRSTAGSLLGHRWVPSSIGDAPAVGRLLLGLGLAMAAVEPRRCPSASWHGAALDARQPSRPAPAF